MQPAAELKRRITAGELTTGILVTDHLWPQVVEIAQSAGLDYIIVDCEHQAHPADLVALVCTVGRLARFPVLLRPAQTSESAVRAAMDLGPCGLLLPAVESAAQLDDVKRAAWLPPRGNRRPGGPGNGWVNQFTYDAFRSEVEDHLIVIPQVETPAGLSAARDIAAHELTTALGIGPFDLSAQLGICGAPLDHPRMQEAISQWREAAQAAGKPTWMIGPGELLCRWGFRFVCIGEASASLRAALRGEISRLKTSLHPG